MPRADFRRVERELHISLPSSAVDQQEVGEYSEPIDPAALLDPRSSTIWGGQMPPDCLPLFGNGCGDAVLARFAMDGSLHEFIEWHHEGGGWHPTDLVPGYESPTARLRRGTEQSLRSGLEKYCQEHGGGSLADALGIAWPAMMDWLADTDRIDGVSRERIRREISLPDSVLFTQDWPRAEELALQANTIRTDLAWPGVVLGRAAERRRDVTAAAAWYVQSLKGLQSTSAFTEPWNGSGRPYSATRLREVGQVAQPHDAHTRACLTFDVEVMRKHWMDLGSMRLREGRATEAYDCFFRAGWDWFSTNDMEAVLDHLVKAADDAGSKAMGALARLHLSSLRALQ